MSLINTRNSGQFASVQPLMVQGAVVPGVAIAPQEDLMGGNTLMTFEGSPIETTNMIHPLTLSIPNDPGAISGTTNSIGKAVSGTSKKFLIGGKSVVTNSAIKIINAGNCPAAPMVQSTQAKSLFTLSG
ncbi:MAG: hypothetical protein NTV32_02575 [Gammaproteobacteria bacterium]|nr:hypothetical protein [Gammaproteobacteria bacterium]